MAATNTNTNTNTSANQAADKMAEEATKRIEENTARVKEFNSAVTETSKASSRVVVDNYEKASKSFYEMQRQVADSTQSDALKEAAKTQIEFAEGVTDAWVKAARKLLK